MRRLIVVSAVAVSAAVAAEAPKKPAAGPGFEVQVIVTDKGDEFFTSWDRPTGRPFNLIPVKEAPRGKLLSTVILFKGCKADAAGNCNTVMDIVTYDPKGNIYGEMLGAELWQRKPAPDPGYNQLSRNYMGLVIEPKDLRGTYRVTVIARDLNAKTEARSEARFDVK